MQQFQAFIINRIKHLIALFLGIDLDIPFKLIT